VGIKSLNDVNATIIREVLESIGGVEMNGYHQFDYDPRRVIAEIVASGLIPEQKSHQYYPTPKELAELAVIFADIQPDDICLEPSAGCGAIAELMPKERTTCIEISTIRAEVLASKDFKVVNKDFLSSAGGISSRAFDKVIMNPPFNQGQWQAHTAAAANLVKNGGKLVAILPSGAKNRLELDGFDVVWHGAYDNKFADASVSVVILVAHKNG
jgi:16S rRNA G966 N2-methylase RsmD